MEYHLGLKKNTGDQQSFRSSEKTRSSQASQSVKLQDRFEPEKSDLSYADLHHEITTNEIGMLPKSLRNHQKQQIDRKGSPEDELVKYMSNLPSYLERGENPKEKVLNVGVLDWGRLEKWQYSSKQMSNGNRRYSPPSSSNASSSFLTDRLSAHSSRGQYFSPTHQRMHRPSLQCHLMASPIEGHSQVAKSFGETAGKFPTIKPKIKNGPEKLIRPDQPFHKKDSEIKLEHCWRKDSDSNINPENVTFLPNEAISFTKATNKNKLGEFTKRTENLQGQNSTSVVQNVSERDKTVVLLLPRDRPQNNHVEVSHFSDSTTILGHGSVEASRRSFAERSKEVYHGKMDSFTPRPCPLPCESESNRHSEMKRPSSIDADSMESTSLSSYSFARPGNRDMTPSRDQNLEGKRSTIISSKLTANEPSSGSDLKTSIPAAEKARSSSPFRRLSISIGNIGKSSITKESSAPSLLTSTSLSHISAKSSSENAAASTVLDSSTSDRSNSTSRARSSPLRRLLEPLLKQKPANCRNIAEPLLDASASTDKPCRISNKPSDSSTVHSGKTKADAKSCRKISNDGSCCDERQGTSTVQALLRVAVKNGLPLFTFAVDKDSDMFAATMSKLCSLRKDDCSLIYTFFSIREVKKKSGSWMNKGGAKGKGQDYVPNVVAQMKVFDSKISNLIGHNFMDQLHMREFVLFSVDLKQADQQAAEFQPNDEHAAIVVKIPTCINQNSIRNGPHSNNYNDVSREARRHSYSGEMGQNQPHTNVQGDMSATVILPSGSHSLPNKGGPSSLIHRWKTGGSCDCGGWDLGCNLKILANSNQSGKKLNLSTSCSGPDNFQLFPQEGEQENQPVFILDPFKDGIYSVEFNSSLSVMQAFSICIAVLDSRKLCEIEDRTYGETITTQKNKGDAPVRYVSYPPLSPVGRV